MLDQLKPSSLIFKIQIPKFSVVTYAMRIFRSTSLSAPRFCFFTIMTHVNIPRTAMISPMTNTFAQKTILFFFSDEAVAVWCYSCDFL